MSDNKCFCHLNGYEVKDAAARRSIAELVNDINTFKERYKGINVDGAAGDLVSDITNILQTLNEFADVLAGIDGGGNGAKLYKHNITLNWQYSEIYDDYTDEYTIRLRGITVYSYDSAPITNIDEIISSGRCISAIGVAELNGEPYVLCGLHREDNDFWAWVVAGEEYQSDWWIGSEYTLEINDVVEEV